MTLTVCGAPSLPIDPFRDSFLADPYAFHAQLRDAGPVIWLESIGAFGMGRFRDVQAALRDHDTFCSGRGVGLADFAIEEPFRPPSLLLEADPPLHDRTRTLMSKIVNLRRERSEGKVATDSHGPGGTPRAKKAI